MQCFNYKDFDHISSECSSRALVIEEQKDVVDEQQEDQVYKPKFEKFDDFEDTFLFCLRALPICLGSALALDTSRLSVVVVSLPNLKISMINIVMPFFILTSRSTIRIIKLLWIVEVVLMLFL